MARKKPKRMFTSRPRPTAGPEYPDYENDPRLGVVEKALMAVLDRNGAKTKKGCQLSDEQLEVLLELELAARAARDRVN